MGESGIVPVAFDLSTLVPKSVASLYSHLVTRPTGQALRLGIESQIRELGQFCVSILDFSQVVVLDYSCADEVIAKLIMNFQRAERPNDAYFVVRGLAEEHTDPIEEVLIRHQLALVAETRTGYSLLGHVSDQEREVWSALEKLGSAEPPEICVQVARKVDEVAGDLDRLHALRTVLKRGNSQRYHSLTSLLRAS